jgi:hypothetical protein
MPGALVIMASDENESQLCAPASRDNPFTAEDEDGDC